MFGIKIKLIMFSVVTKRKLFCGIKKYNLVGIASPLVHIRDVTSSTWVLFQFLVNGISGLKEYIGANPAFKYEASSSVVQSKLSDIPSGEYVDEEIEEQFYDATDSSSDEEESDEDDDDQDQDKKVTWFCFLLVHL